MQQPFMIRCRYRQCEHTVNAQRVQDTRWLGITIEREKVKSVWWFCCPDHAMRMMARAISEMCA